MVLFFNLKTKKYKASILCCLFLACFILGLSSCNRAKNAEVATLFSKEQYRSIGEQIRKERIRRGMTQLQLAEAVSLSQNALSLIEDGLATPIQHKIIAIEEYLGIDLIINLPTANVIDNK